MTGYGRSRWALAAVALAAAPVAAGAQSYAPPPPATVGYINAPDVIAHCLCEEQRVATLHQVSQDAERRFKAAQAKVDRLKRELEETRTTLNPEDEAQLDAYRRKLEEQEEAQAILFNDEQPALSKAVDQYNVASQAYNAQCANRQFDSLAMEDVRRTLSCPPVATQLPPP